MTRSVPDLATLDALDSAEVIEGYWSGFDGEPEPGNNRSLAFWHGWRNGASDKGLRAIDAEQRQIVRLVVARGHVAGVTLSIKPGRSA